MNELKVVENQTPIEIALGIDSGGMTTAKKLYEFLGLDKKNYSHWCKRNIDQNEFAEENVDYWAFVIKDERNYNPNPTTDYRLTANFAKKLSMMQKTEKGEAARDYFIGVEIGAKKLLKEQEVNERELVADSAINTKEITTADRIRVMELLVNCPEHAFEYVVTVAQPFMEKSQDLVELGGVRPLEQSNQEYFADSAKKSKEPSIAKIERTSTAGYAVPFDHCRLRRRLSRIKMTKSELARQSGVDVRLIRRYLNGAARPSKVNREKLCAAIGKPANWLNKVGKEK